MARYVKVGAICTAPITADFELGMDSIVKIMIDFWDHQLENVLTDKPDIIVLYEAADRFAKLTLEQKLAYYEFRGEKILCYFKRKAKENNCYIAYPYVRKMRDGTYRNSVQLIDRQGNIVGTYNKNYLVVTEISDSNVLCGKDAPVFECDFGKVSFAICFDLNFRGVLEQYKNKKPELLLFPSMYHGGFMQNYWAYEIGCYFVSAVAGIECTVISPVGEKIANSTNYFSHLVHKINLDYKLIHLDFNWDKIEMMKKKYGDKIKVSDPGKVGAVMISSETDEFTTDEIIKEFDIELLEDYFERSIKCRAENTEN